MTTQDDRRSLYNEFLKTFPLENLNNLPIEQYTNLDNTSFCYWLERKTVRLGSAKGGSSFKFGIYEYQNQPTSKFMVFDDRYAWYKKYAAETSEKAYEIVREEIVRIANFAREGKFEEIDDLTVLGDVCKWKIAFLYSNETLVPIYQHKMLSQAAVALGMEPHPQVKISELQKFIMDKKGDKDLFEYSDELLPVANEQNTVWLYAPGENAKLWDECVEKGKIYLGWDELGDLNQYASRKAVADTLKEKRGTSKNDSLTIWNFIKELQVGDVVYAKRGRKIILGRGVITSDYYYDSHRNEYRNVRNVDWDLVGEWTININSRMPIKTLTKITRSSNLVALNSLVEDDGEQVQNDPSSKNYWWLNANPKVWTLNDWKLGEEEDYTLYNENGNKRRIFQNFLNAKVGDPIICYEASPTKQILCLAVVSKPSNGRSIFFKKTELLSNPIDYESLKNIQELQNMEFLKNSSGSFFKLTKEEYDILMKLIRETNEPPTLAVKERYSVDDFLSEVFIPSKCYNHLKSQLLRKKNIVLQGAPGVGKTFCAKRLAYSIMGEKDEERIAFVQFHQNYSYEDFVEGYRPHEDGFLLQKGIFYNFCNLAKSNPDKEYFFIIDEINRGNLSKIFGELLMLIEKGYRGEEITLAYSGDRFYVPENIYLIGMMNTADRSLAMIDYALRRRFSFFNLKPAFQSELFLDKCRKLQNEKYNRLVDEIMRLNKAIETDDSLGEGFEIGHSYLCFNNENEVTDEWLHSVVNYDIIPMLQEYWFDSREKINEWTEALNKVLND